MYVFLKERMIYPAVCTQDRKHWILVGCTEEQLKNFEEEYKLKRGEESIWLAHRCHSKEQYQTACWSLPQRLSPLFNENEMPYESFYKMHKYFYINDHCELMVKGVVFDVEGEKTPFVKANTAPDTGFMCLADVKLNA